MTAAPDTRKRELAQIHIAKAQLNMADESYRDILWTVARVRSAADLDWSGRKAVIEHMKACGFKAKPPAKPKPARGGWWDWVNNAAPDRQAMLRKIAVMLKDANPEREKGYADSMARHMFGIQIVEFCAPDQLHKIVAALMEDQRRNKAKAATP